MSNTICWLLTILYGDTVLRVAVCFERDKFTQDEIDYPMETETRAKIRATLPLHIRECGPILDIEEIFEVVKP